MKTYAASGASRHPVCFYAVQDGNSRRRAHYDSVGRARASSREWEAPYGMARRLVERFGTFLEDIACPKLELMMASLRARPFGN